MNTELFPGDSHGVDAYCSSGPSPTVRLHLLGIGAVGRAYLTLNHDERVVGVSDSSGTALDPRGLPTDVLIREKAAGRAIVDIPELVDTWADDAEPSACANLVIDVTPSRLERGPADAARIRRWLARGQRVALASKHAIAADPTLLEEPHLGANAVLGGTGARLQCELPELRAHWTALALAGNASTTTIITCIEEGGSFAEGLARADAVGVLEPDPELDLQGRDAAIKLALVAGALEGRPRSVDEVAVQDLRDVPIDTLRATAQAGRTTRLVGRATRDGLLLLRYEAVDRHDPIAVGPEGVAYQYSLGTTQRVHQGGGVGALGTARALAEDVARLRAIA